MSPRASNLLHLELKTFLERDAAENAGALAVDHHQRESAAELMNAVKHSGCWGVPARRLAVALSATSPRADYRAAGFPLQSLTRNALTLILSNVLIQSASSQVVQEEHYLQEGIGGFELFLHADGTYRSYSYGCTEQSTDSGTYSQRGDTVSFTSHYALKDNRNANLSIRETASILPSVKDTLVISLHNKSTQPAYEVALQCGSVSVEKIYEFPAGSTYSYYVPLSTLKGENTVSILIGDQRLDVSGKQVVVLEIRGKTRFLIEPLDLVFVLRNGELCPIIDIPDVIIECVKKQ